MTRRAAIDVGSNSIKLLVLDIRSEFDYDIIHDSQQVTGLGTGIGPRGQLNPVSREQSEACIAGMVRTAAGLGAKDILIGGTSALRRAADAREFASAIQQATGLRIRILTESAEARLSRTVALRELGHETGTILFFDVGGGSTELTLFDGEQLVYEVSLPLGARLLAETAGFHQPPAAGQLEDAQNRIAAALESGLLLVSESAARSTSGVAGLGGTATALACMVAGITSEGLNPHMYRLSRPQVDNAISRLATMELSDLKQLPKMDLQRAPVFLAGVLVISGILSWYGAEGFTLVDRGLRFGLLLADQRTDS